MHDFYRTKVRQEYLTFSITKYCTPIFYKILGGEYRVLPAKKNVNIYRFDW